MDNTSSIYVPHGSCYEDSSVFQYQKMNYESYQLNNWTSTKLIISEIPFFYVIGNKKLYDVSIIYILYYQH